MRGRTHRDQVICKAQIMLGEKSGDSRKALCQINAGELPHIQVHGKLLAVSGSCLPV